MKKRLAPRQEVTYEYTLPGDEIKASAMALAMGNLAALRDFPNTLADRNEIETQARAGCVTLKSSYKVRKQLTNDFPLFCELFIKWYVNCYTDIAQQDEQSRAYREEMKRFAEEAGWLQMCQLLQKQYAAQLSSQIP